MMSSEDDAVIRNTIEVLERVVETLRGYDDGDIIFNQILEVEQTIEELYAVTINNNGFQNFSL